MYIHGLIYIDELNWVKGFIQLLSFLNDYAELAEYPPFGWVPSLMVGNLSIEPNRTVQLIGSNS